MITWTGDQVAHEERARAHIDRLARQYRERLTRAMVAAGLLRGHLGADGSVCVGHFAPEHGAAVGQLDGQAPGIEAGPDAVG